VRPYPLRRPLVRALIATLDWLGDRLLSCAAPSWPVLAERTVVLRLDQLGDIVQSLPFFDALHETWPGRRVDVLTTPQGREVLDGHPAVAEILVWACPWFGPARPFDLPEWRSQVARLRSKGYQAAVDLRGDLRTILTLWWSGIPTRIGYGTTGGGFLLTHELPWQPELHAVDKSLELAARLGARVVGRVPRLRGRKGTFPRGREVLLAVHPDSGTEAKRWSEESFVAALRLLLRERLDFRIVLVGLDRARGERIRAALDSDQVLDFMGKTDLPALIDLLASADGLLTNDSGPAHLAAALGKPVWILWSGTAPSEVWKPRGGIPRLFETWVPCSPCSLRDCPVAGHPCLSRLEPEEVARGILADLAPA
jgi:ADP-heptose:LPS heptosyltransferase